MSAFWVVFCAYLAVIVLLGELAAIAAMLGSGVIAAGWRGLGLEAETGIHMLNLGLPAGLAILVAVALASKR